MKNPFLTYETKITLLLLILVLLLTGTNLVTLWLLKRSERKLDLELSQTLQFVAKTAMGYIEKGETDEKALEQLLLRKGVSKVFVIDPQQRLLLSAPSILDPLAEPIWGGFDEASTAELWRGTPSFSSLYRRKKSTFKAYGLPFGRGSVKNILFVEGEAGFLDVLQRGYKIAVGLSGCIFLIAPILGIFYLRTVIAPYRKITRSASNIYENTRKRGEIEFAVDSFERVIRELKKKEGMLARLYSKSRAKADNLERFTKHILENIPTGVFSYDDMARVTYSNEASKRILNGIPRRAFKPLVDAALKKGETYLSKELKFPDGRFLGVSSSVLKDKTGRTTGVTLLFRDITEMKRLEEEMSFKEKMAALGEMSPGIAHEFRNSLASILGYAKLLKRNLRSSPQESYTTSLVEECLSMESTIKQFLDFSRPEQIDIEEFDLGELLREVEHHFAEQLARSQISLKRRTPRKRLTIWGDRLLLKRALVNVVQNAIEATARNGAIHLTLLEKNSDYHLRIGDSGAGIKSEIRNRVFTPFFTTKKTGTGLGLSIVQKIVAAHKGNVSLKSTTGRGTTVLITLPKLLPKSHNTVTPESQNL